jgi:hypothetical protein
MTCCLGLRAALTRLFTSAAVSMPDPMPSIDPMLLPTDAIRPSFQE